tara:strand:+ start:229 stop:1347 length:1119 start_codon:yes stop_codon:yes gene_type:complete
VEIQDILVKNSFSISGSFEIPIVETTASISTDLATGSMFYDMSSNLLYVASGSEFIIVGIQEGLAPPDYDIEYMVVGAGGGGGMDMGGGGGAGGFVTSTFNTTPGIVYTANVGAGGTGGPAGGSAGQGTSHQFQIAATNGATSSLSGDVVDVSMLGGGKGGSSYYTYTPDQGQGGAGASGGGCSGYSNGSTKAGGAGTAGQGFNGGQGGGQYYSGGGGGSSAAGVNSTGTPHGGAGTISAITGTSYSWAGGGGGSSYSLSTGGNGGAGGGGGGALGTTTGGSGLNAGSAGGGGSPNSQTNRPGGNAGTNTGGGGGGGSHYNSNNQGGNGGSGIVVLKMPTTSYTGTVTGTPTVSTDGGDTVVIFTASGTYTS